MLQHPAPRQPGRSDYTPPSDGAGSTALAAFAAGLLGVVVAAPALIAGGALWLLIRGNKGRALLVGLSVLAGWGVLYLRHEALILTGRGLFTVVQGLRAGQSHWADLPRHIVQLWQLTWPLAPTVALLIESLRPRSFVEQQQSQRAAEAQRVHAQRQAATQRAAKAPEQVQGVAVLGAAVAGQRGAPAFCSGPWAVYPADLLNRHAVVIGSSGTGKTEFVLRLAYLARKVYGWRVFYLDAKGDATTAERFAQAMRQVGTTRIGLFPERSYDAWRGDATAIFNRLIAVESFSEPYYRAITKLLLSLACHAPAGPPRSSTELLSRLRLEELARHYAGHPHLQDVLGIGDKEAKGAYSRYRALFSALGDKLDGGWAWEDVDAGYLLLDGLALKEEARGLGRYLLEDFGQAMVKRVPRGERVLLIVDEFSALASSAEAEGLFERVRSPHGDGGAGVVVTSQSYAALGEGADRMLQAAATTVVFQCADPERLSARAGLRPAYTTSLRGRLGRSVMTLQRTTGEGSVREGEAPVVHPDQIRRLGVGECFLLPAGAAQQVRVARLRIAGPAAVIPSPPSELIRPVVVPVAGATAAPLPDILLEAAQPTSALASSSEEAPSTATPERRDW